MSGRETGPQVAVVGWPIGHSRSPLIHRTWLERYGLRGRYEALALPPEEADAFFADFASSGLAGCNVTVPHKERAARLVDRLTDRARRLGAVNTIWLEDGDTVGDNTDGEGFLASLEQAVPGWAPEAGGTALIVGAGGAARAIAGALAEHPGIARIEVVNRTAERAQALAEAFGDKIRPGGLDRFESALPDADLIVNTTTLGLGGREPWPFDLDAARRGTVAADIVYTPLWTPFLLAAKARGLTPVTGLGMLLHQAVPGFERWFGIRPEVDQALHDRVLADIGAAH